MNTNKIEKENIMQKLNKPKFIDIAIISCITAIITPLIFYLFPDDTTKFEMKVIICLTFVLILTIVLLIIEIVKIRNFYKDYDKQYDYFINQFNISNDKTDKKIKKLEKNIKDINDKQDSAIYYEEVGEIDEETGKITYYDKPKNRKKL